MHSTLRLCGYIFILILCFYNTSFSQPPPPTLPCDDCAGSGTLSAQLTLTVILDSSSGGCRAKITYYKRTCKNFTNIFVTNYKIIGSNCSSLTDVTKIDRALSRLIYDDLISLPPATSGDGAAYWRVRRPACWQKTNTTNDTVSYTSCPSAGCCESYFKATVGDCGKRISYIPMNDTAECPAPTPPIECIHSCGRDPIEGWR